VRRLTGSGWGWGDGKEDGRVGGRDSEGDWAGRGDAGKVKRRQRRVEIVMGSQIDFIKKR
jgi:hypothetical protein